MYTKSNYQCSEQGRPRLVSGLFMTDSNQPCVFSESKASILRAYIPVERLLLESVRKTLGSFIKAYLDHDPIIVDKRCLDNIVCFLQQTDTLYLAARKDSRGIIKL